MAYTINTYEDYLASNDDYHHFLYNPLNQAQKRAFDLQLGLHLKRLLIKYLFLI